MNRFALTTCVVGVLLCAGLILYMLAHAFRDLRLRRPKYRELKAGEVIREGDEWHAANDMWVKSSRIGKEVPPGLRDIRYRRLVKEDAR